MADRATGPVKPPVIDLTARSGGRPDPADAPQAEPAAATSRWPDWLAFDVKAGWPSLGVAILLGAVIGTLLTYLLASVVPLPQRAPSPDLTPQLTAEAARVDALATDLAALEASVGRTQQSLDATIAQLDAGLSELRQSAADLRSAIPQQSAPVDLAPLQTELRTLRSRVDAIAAGASGTDASAIASSIAAVEASLDGLATRLNGVDASIGALRTDLDAARRSVATAAPPSRPATDIRLPLILSGLENAISTGRPFQQELASLKSVLPDLAVPASVDGAATGGLIRAEALQQRFEATLPEIFAARETASGDWTANAVDWAKSLLALRPAEEVEGDSPEAIISRIEGAMARRDYAAASALIAELPPPMREAAAPVAGDIAARAEADAFVAAIRARALQGANAT